MIEPPARENAAKLAPAWHTGALVGLIVSVAVAGTLLSGSTFATPPIADGSKRLVSLYLPPIVVDWCLVLYVCRIGRSTNVLFTMVGELPRTARAMARDLTLGAAGFAIIEAGEACAATFSQVGGADAAARAASSLLPTTAAERLAWIAFAVSAGVCEEIIYRGYLLTQLRAFARSTAAGVALQAILFGIAHLDQGGFTAARFAVYGAGLGVVACWRKSLVPGILCHVAIDTFSGLLAASSS